MGTLKKLEIPRYDIHGRKMRGTVELVQLERTPRPFVKKQLIEVTVTIEPATFTKPAVIKKEIFCGDFMGVVGKAQAKYPKKTISYRSVDTRPDWLKKEREEEEARKKAETEKPPEPTGKAK